MQAGTGDVLMFQLIDPNDPMRGETLHRQILEPHMLLCNSTGPNKRPIDRRIEDVRPRGVVIKKLSSVS